MAELNNVHESCLPAHALAIRQLPKLREQITRVADEIGYRGRGTTDTTILAKELDRRGIRPLNRVYGHRGHMNRWYQGRTKGSARLVRFLKKYMPDLYERGAPAKSQSESSVRQIGMLPRRERLMEQIRDVASEFGYGGRKVDGDTIAFAKELDSRGIAPLTPSPVEPGPGTWYRPNQKVSRLGKFLKTYMPDLFEHGVAGDLPNTCLCDRCPLNAKESCARRSGSEKGTEKAVSHEDGAREEATPPTNLGGWTLCHDSRGIYKAVKRIEGKLKSIYVGRDSSRAGEKIEEWLARQNEEIEEK